MIKQLLVNCTEVIDSLRNKRNYDEDVAKHDFKQTGISEDSIFNTISSFHVVENYAVDMMHDLFKGICVYTMNHVILRLIDLGYFNLETVSNRKQCFNYGNTEIGNISPPLKLKNLKNIKFKMTAREMQTFIHFFPLIIGDLVPKNDLTWIFFINFVELIDLLLLPSFDNCSILKLQEHIEYNNKTYVELFNDNLKPKHHFLTHYCNIIQQSGPLRYLWSYNFESKHRQLKTYTKNITSRINVPISLGIKYSLIFSDFLYNFNIDDYFSFKSLSEEILYVEFMKQINKESLDNNRFLLNEVLCYDKIMYANTIYNIDHILATFHENALAAYIIKKNCVCK